MKMSLKSWLTKTFGVPADANDDAFNAALGQSWLSDDDTKKMTPDLFKELNTDAATKAAGEFDAKLDKILADNAELKSQIAELKSARTAGGLSATVPPLALDLNKAFAAGANADQATVKHIKACERYSNTKSAMRYPDTIATQKGAMVHPRAGEMMVEPVTGQQIHTLSDLDKAVCAAFFKWHLTKNPVPGMSLPETAKMTDHDRELMAYALEELPWTGEHTSAMIAANNMSPDVLCRKLTELDRKALGDETVSGGQYLSPAVWDQAIITIPYLNGQFFPRVTVVPIKGRRVEGAVMTQVNISSQAQDSTQDIPLETTANFATAFNTNIHVANGAILVSNDLMADSPVNIGAKLTEEYGKALLTWLDEQIQVGDGTTEPQGVFNATGTTTVAGGGVAFTIAKYMDLIAAVPYAYRQGVPPSSRCFAGTDTSYWRARALAAGAGGVNQDYVDQAHDSYTLLKVAYAIAGSWQTNAQINYGCYNRYRMYQGLGATPFVETKGYTLVRANQTLFGIRARFGGQIEDGSAFSKTTTALV